MPRTILLDMRATVVRPTGVGVMARELARTLARKDPESRYVLFSNSYRDRFPADGYRAPNVRVVDRRIPHRLLARGWNGLRWPSVEWLAGRCSIAHAMEPIPLPVSRARTVVTVNDLFFLRHPEWTDPAQTEHLRANIRRLLPQADRVLTISDHVREEVLGEFGLEPDRVRTVHLGLRPDQLEPPTREQVKDLRSRLRLPPGYILQIGTIEPRKNAGGLIRAFAQLRNQKRHDGTKVILCGRRGHLYHTQEKAVADCNITTEVRILDYLNDEEVKTLISLARLVVVPSLDEGFCLPLVEAMAQGIPVAASRRGAIPEVSGGAAALFDPDEPEEMVETLARALTDESLRRDLATRGPARAARFTWDATAEGVLGVYAELA